MGSDKADKKRAKAEWKAQKMRHEAEKKSAKAEAKIAKKRAEAGLPPETAQQAAPSKSERFTDIVRGGLYALLGFSLLAALMLGQRDAVVSLDDLIESLFLATAGKIVLAVIGVALALYGLRKVRGR